MKTKKYWIVAFALLWSLFLLGGCSQTIKYYPGPYQPFDKVATLKIHDKRVNLKVDGELVNWDRSPSAFNAVEIMLLPGTHKLEWEWTHGRINFRHIGSGTLDAEPSVVYSLYFDVLVVDVLPSSLIKVVPRGEVTDPSTRYKVQSVCVWIENDSTGEVVVGDKLPWANYTYWDR